MSNSTQSLARPVEAGFPRARQRFAIPALGRAYAAWEPVSYAALRVVFGAILLSHGLPKALGGAHGQMADPFGTTALLVETKIGLPFPTFFAYCVTALETVGAVCIAAGFLTRIAAPMIAVEMAMICVVFYPVWAWLDHGMEYAFFMGVLALHIAVRGGDRFSVDRLIGREI